MWIADNWKDYEVLDCSQGEKLERWGDYLLIRPDPQVIWDTPKTLKGWRKCNAPLPPQQEGRRRVGVLRPSVAVDHPLQGADLQSEALQLQAHRALPGAGRQLGLVG